MENQRAWVKTTNKTIKQHKAFYDAVINNPNVRRDIARFLSFLKQQVNKEQMTQQQALAVFKTTVKQISNSIEEQVKRLQPPTQPSHHDLSNPTNMTAALQTPGSLANTLMADSVGAIGQIVNGTIPNPQQENSEQENIAQANIEQANIAQANAEIEPENQQAGNLQQQSTDQPDSGLTQAPELVAACELTKNVIEDSFGKGADQIKKPLTEAFKDIGETMGFKTDEIKDIEKDVVKAVNPFKLDLKPEPPEEK